MSGSDSPATAANRGSDSPATAAGIVAATAEQRSAIAPDRQSNCTYPPLSLSSEAKKEEQNTAVSNSKESLIPSRCSFEGEYPITNHNTTFATCMKIWYGKRPI
mmetsp:Transcript_5555/g.11824  ORF Transcript_5555/g.11824 Transcript_5555/m.11824 type:complete len:104 (-) Transcript_5555:10-321(-)